GVVRHAAVGVDAARVIPRGLAVELRAVAHPPRIAERVRVHHVPNRADPGNVLADEPTRRGRIGARPVQQIDRLPENVRERLVEGAGLHVVEEVGGVFGHSVGQLVGIGVIRCREPVAVHHLCAVPERVPVVAVVVGRTVMHRGYQRSAGPIKAVAPMLRPEVIVGIAREIIGGIGVGVPRRGPSFGPHEGAGQCIAAIGGVDGSVQGVGDLAEIEQPQARVGIAPDELPHLDAPGLDEPRQMRLGPARSSIPRLNTSRRGWLQTMSSRPTCPAISASALASASSELIRGFVSTGSERSRILALTPTTAAPRRWTMISPPVTGTPSYSCWKRACSVPMWSGPCVRMCRTSPTSAMPKAWPWARRNARPRASALAPEAAGRLIGADRVDMKPTRSLTGDRRVCTGAPAACDIRSMATETESSRNGCARAAP